MSGSGELTVDGFNRVPVTDTAPFGVWVKVVEPSGLAMHWAGSPATDCALSDTCGATAGVVDRRVWWGRAVWSGIRAERPGSSYGLGSATRCPAVFHPVCMR